ncbi:MAG: PD-(D/E)XK nuclease family protein [Nitrospiraceae bacterium]
MTLYPMLNVITGRFHPSLEVSLIDHLNRLKSDDPFAPLAILVPSRPLLDHIKRLLSQEQQRSWINVHVLTFHQLALRLADEVHGQDQSVPVRVVDDLFFEQFVRYLVRNQLSGLSPLQHIGHSSGTWAALWSSVRDLKDAGVDPAAAIRGLTEGCFDKDDRDWLHALFSLCAAVKEVGRTLEVGTADDLAESILPFVPSSPFLASLRHAFYYGFYDLTQVQLSLFGAISAAAPTTLFFPLEGGPSFGFARRFFDRHIQPLVSRPEALIRFPVPEPSVNADRPALTISSVIGPEEELASTCRTILDLVETNGFRFEEIGVVARTLDPYCTLIQGVFDRHCVPFEATAARPLIHEPLCKLLLQLASLPLNDFYRTSMLDIITSPLYQSSTESVGSVHYRPEQWKVLVSVLHITHGRDEWERVKQASQAALALDGEEDDATQRVSVNIAPDVSALCWQVVAKLLDECAALPPRGTIGQLLDAFQQLVFRHVRRPGAELVEVDDPRTPRLHSTWNVIERTLSTLQHLDVIGEDLSWAEFVNLLTHAFERASVPVSSGAHRGVRVLDAMAARGLPFKALFVLGLNDKTFPRYILEDPFLRDRHRLVLDTTLGFKIDEKLAGYDEEGLLFTLLCQAATQRLYVSFQRADDNGRVLAASPYVMEGAKRLNLPDCPIESVPRRLTDRIAHRPAMRLFLPPADLTQWMAMQGRDPVPLLLAIGQDAELFRHAATALDHIEADSPSLTAFDGQTGPLSSHWSRIVQRGIAPTPLERYARCPFQYFAADVLRLEPVRLPITQEPDAVVLGTFCHAVLRRCYESLLRAGWPGSSLTGEVMRRFVDESIEQATADSKIQHQIGYYLLWELAKEQIAALVLAAVNEPAQAEDLYQPIAFEVEAEGEIRVTMRGHSVPIKVQGRVDRIDRHRDSGALRIVDYKYKSGSAMKSEDRHLVQSAAQGKRMQPPLYACLDFPEQDSAREVQLFFLAPHWPVSIVRSTFSSSVWASESGALIRQTLTRLAEGISDGRFFIVPGTHCKTCDYRVACRREHQLTWWRASRSAESKELRSLRTLRVKDE